MEKEIDMTLGLSRGYFKDPCFQFLANNQPAERSGSQVFSTVEGNIVYIRISAAAKVGVHYRDPLTLDQ